jgi:hypothetical protein
MTELTNMTTRRLRFAVLLSTGLVGVTFLWASPTSASIRNSTNQTWVDNPVGRDGAVRELVDPVFPSRFAR